VWLCARAGWYVYGSYPSDISRWLYDGARLFNLWHGVGGIKNLERLVTTGLTGVIHRQRPAWSPIALGFRDDRRAPDYVLTTSPAMTERAFSPGFGVPPERCLQFGYPRVDHFFPGGDLDTTPLTVSRETLDQVRSASFAIGYFPTWRDDGSDFLSRAGVRLPELARTVAELGGTLVYKPHFNTRSEVVSQDGLIVLDRNDDVNVYLPHCRALVTDYSSIASDFLLLDRPILYFTPDFEEYRRQRQSLFPLEAVMPGAVVPTVAELVELIRRTIAGEDAYAPARAAARTLLWATYRGGASRAILAFIREVNAGGHAWSELPATPSAPVREAG
jgi:CDP-glycerol glycerophosphotransferase